MADTALSSELFLLISCCDVVTRRKFVRFVGSAAAMEAPATASDTKDEKRIV